VAVKISKSKASKFLMGRITPELDQAAAAESGYEFLNHADSAPG
jgi:hypothetical protein